VKFALVVWHDEEHSESPQEIGSWPEHRDWFDDLTSRGVVQSHARLRPKKATTVRVRDGETLISDGPFAETKDFIGGFLVIECADLDEAIKIASGHAFAAFGAIEVAPLWE
jgi:hypothetical protein